MAIFNNPFANIINNSLGQIKFAKKIMTDLNQSKFVNIQVIVDQSSNQIESALNQKVQELQQALKCGNYVKADELKVEIQKLKKDFKQKKLKQMIVNHKGEKKKIQQDQQRQVNQILELWNKKMSDFTCQKEKLKQQLLSRHEEQLLKAKQTLQTQIPFRMKQSSECLNLRKIQEQMKKQKKYSKAHHIQQQVLQMEKKEKIMFQKQRQIKIQTALTTLKSKQKIQMQALNKKIESGQKQLLKEKDKQIQKIKLKHMNSMKDLLSLQQKQLLGEKGQIKSRAMMSSCRSRSKFTSLKKF